MGYEYGQVTLKGRKVGSSGGLIEQIENAEQHTYKTLTRETLQSFIEDLYMDVSEPQPFVIYTSRKGGVQMNLLIRKEWMRNRIDKNLFKDKEFRRIFNKVYHYGKGKNKQYKKATVRRHKYSSYRKNNKNSRRSNSNFI